MPPAGHHRQRALALVLWGLAYLACPVQASEHTLFRETTFRHSPAEQQLFNQLQALETALIERSQRFTLQQVLVQGLKANPKLGATYARLQGKQWSVVAARRRWFPSLSADSDSAGLIGKEGDRTTTNSSTSAALGTSTTAVRTLATPLLSLEWTFVDLGRDAQIQAATSGMQAERWLFDVSARNLVLELQSDYTDLQEKIDLIDEYRALFLLSSNAVDSAEDRLRSQTPPRPQTRTELAQLRTFQRNQLTRLINATRELLLASTRLTARLALDGEAMVLPEDGLQPQDSWPLDLSSTLNQAVQLREEIKALAADANRSGWEAQELLRSYWPQLSLQAEAGGSNLSISRLAPGAGAAETTDRSSWDGFLGLGLKWRLFNGGVETAEASNRTALQVQLRQEQALESLAIEQQVKEAYFNYTTSKLGLANTSLAVRSAADSLSSALNKAQRAMVSTTTLIQMMDQYLDAIWARTSTVRLHNNSIHALYRASAQWPAGTLPLLQERVGELKTQ